MMTIATLRAALSALAVLGVAWASAASAAPQPTLSDIASCNEDAAARTTASALPAPGGRPPQARAPITEGERELPGRAGRGEKSDPTGSIVTESSDPLVHGMDAQKAGDPAYRSAYRACMKDRLAR